MSYILVLEYHSPEKPGEPECLYFHPEQRLEVMNILADFIYLKENTTVREFPYRSFSTIDIEDIETLHPEAFSEPASILPLFRSLGVDLHYLHTFIEIHRRNTSIVKRSQTDFDSEIMKLLPHFCLSFDSQAGSFTILPPTHTMTLDKTIAEFGSLCSLLSSYPVHTFTRHKITSHIILDLVYGQIRKASQLAKQPWNFRPFIELYVQTSGQTI